MQHLRIGILIVLLVAATGCNRGVDRRSGAPNLHGSSRTVVGSAGAGAPAGDSTDGPADASSAGRGAPAAPIAAAPPPEDSDRAVAPAGATGGPAGATGPRDAALPRDPDAPARLRPFPGVSIEVRRSRVELDATICLDQGWLEQIACSPGTREHEALLVPDATPSQVHAALLAAGFSAGDPGRWLMEGQRVRLLPPSGSRLRIAVRYAVGSGEFVEHSVREWVRDHHGRSELPDEPWVFGGSAMAENPDWLEPGEHYVADMTGSIIGLVTFGDEVIGFSRVLSDAAAVHAPEWEADPERMPPVGTRVKIVIEPW